MGGPEAAGMAQDIRERMQTAIDLVSNFVTTIEAITLKVVATVNAALAFFQDIDNEEIKRSYQLKTALHEVERVAQLADTLFVKVETFFHFIKGETMAAATAGLNSSPPDTKDLCDLMALLKTNLVKNAKKWEELENACQQVITNCKRAAKMCARKEKECHRKRIIAVPVVCTLVAVGVYVAFKYNVIGTGEAVTVAVGTCICANFTDGFLKKSAESFQKIHGKLYDTRDSASETKEKVIEYHDMLKNWLNHIGYINESVMKENPAMMKDTLARFKDVCAKSCTIISQCKHQVEGKLEEFIHRKSAGTA